MDKDLLFQSKKENLFYSKELESLIDSSSNKDLKWSFYYAVVLNNKTHMLKYISFKKRKNRIKIKALFNESSLKDIVKFDPIEISLIYKDDVIKNINFKDNSIEKNIKLNNKNNYIITYKIFI